MQLDLGQAAQAASRYVLLHRYTDIHKCTALTNVTGLRSPLYGQFPVGTRTRGLARVAPMSSAGSAVASSLHMPRGRATGFVEPLSAQKP